VLNVNELYKVIIVNFFSNVLYIVKTLPISLNSVTANEKWPIKIRCPNKFMKIREL